MPMRFTINDARTMPTGFDSNITPSEACSDGNEFSNTLWCVIMIVGRKV